MAPEPGPPQFDDLGAVAGAALIETLAAQGRVEACAPGACCPAEPALREAAGAWIVRAAGVPAAAPP
ncbi:MAG: hypothetical protein HY744_00905 [Deltaproteobacteria bacterium]|nr:hypothetical protein [Deltaproteobacteria bacterium]